MNEKTPDRQPHKAAEITTLTRPHQIDFAVLCARKAALRLEMLGLRHSSRRSIYALCKKVYGLKGNRQRVYAQMCQLVEDMKERKVELVPPS